MLRLSTSAMQRRTTTDDELIARAALAPRFTCDDLDALAIVRSRHVAPGLPGANG